MKINYALIMLTLSAFYICAQELTNPPEPKTHGYVPPNGFIPDSTTAISIAEAILIPIYGKAQIQDQKPFKAALSKEIWTVTGHMDEGALGGVAEVQISKKNGCILRVTHGR